MHRALWFANVDRDEPHGSYEQRGGDGEGEGLFVERDIVEAALVGGGVTVVRGGLF